MKIIPKVGEKMLLKCFLRNKKSNAFEMLFAKQFVEPNVNQ